MQWLRNIVADLFITRTKFILLAACKNEPPKCPPPKCDPIPKCPPSPKCDPPLKCDPPPKSPSAKCCSSPTPSICCPARHCPPPPPKCYPLPTCPPCSTLRYCCPPPPRPCCPPPPCPCCRPPPCCPPRCTLAECGRYCWKNANRKYDNPIKTPKDGFISFLALLFGIAGGLGIVTYLNRTKPKPPRKYICYHPPPPYLEHEPPPNCCRPTIVNIYDDECDEIPGKKENTPKDCYRIKILDPCNIHDHDPCERFTCKPGDGKEDKK